MSASPITITHDHDPDPAARKADGFTAEAPRAIAMLILQDGEHEPAARIAPDAVRGNTDRWLASSL